MKSGGSRVQLRGKAFAEQEAALAPVQRDGETGRSTADIHEAAANGIAGGGSKLPHFEAIQQSFGRHDVSAVQAHTDGAARAASSAIGASAYASGSHVALGAGTDLHTVAHEAAHVVQQRSGVSLSGGVGQSGDAYEKHADAVADAVVQGKSAQGLLDGMAGGGGGRARDAVQRAAVKSHMGTFTDEKYELEGDQKQHIVVKFTPGDNVDATKIGMIQSIKDMRDGAPNSIDPAARKRKSNDGHAIDRLSDKDTPVYGSPSLGGGKDLEDTPDDNNKTVDPTQVGTNATFETGYRKKNGDAWDTKDAGLSDSPTMFGGPLSSKEFETTALALDGEQKGTYYGSIKWGWKKDQTGVISAVPFSLGSMGVPTKEFLGAAEKWNAGKVRGSMRAIADGTKTYSSAGAEVGVIDKATVLTMVSSVTVAGKPFLKCKLPDNTIVYMVRTDVEDAGDGAALKQLPGVEVHVTTVATEVYADNPVRKSGGSGVSGLKNKFEGEEKPTLLKCVPKQTRVKIVEARGDKALIEVVDGPHTGLKGVATAANLRKE